MKIGIKSAGAYIPYYYMQRATIGAAWGGRGGKGNKAIANVDEDSVTMAVEAAMDAFRRAKREEIDELYFASTTAPYAEKSHATIITTAVDLGKNVYTADAANSTKSGADALKAALDAVGSGSASNVMVTAADCRNAYPKSASEPNLGDAAAAAVISNDDLVAVFDAFSAVNNEIVDVWRNEGEKYIRTAEGRFRMDKGYHTALKLVISDILNKTGLKPEDFAKIVISAPDAKEYAKVAKKAGFAPEQVQDPLMMEVGDCGAAQPLLLLTCALETCKPGDRILLAAYGNGANAFVFTATDKVLELQQRPSVQKYLDNRMEFTSYARFLSFRGIASADPGAPFKLPASTAMTWREQDTYLRLYASECKKCGAKTFPINRVCPDCGSINEFRSIRASDHISKIFTYSIDNYAGRSDNPIEVQTVAEDSEGIRYYTIMTDFVPAEVKVGMELEFSFRKIHTLGNFNNYFWKFRPLRREKV